MLRVIEEAQGSVFDLLLVHTPSITEIIQDVGFGVEHLNGSLLTDVLKTNDTVRDTGRSQDAYPTDLGSVVSVGTTASLCVDSLDVDDTKRVAWNDTALVEGETELELSLSLVHESLRDVVSIVNQSVGGILNLLFLLTSQALEVSDVKMSLLFGLLGTSLPDVRSKHLATRCEYQMSSSVMSLQLSASFSIDGAESGLADGVDIIWDLCIDLV